ncbi:MAG: MarR family winged helix-turn-helix transcriptional regulator [Clostridium sp.]
MDKPDWIIMLENMQEIRRFSRLLIKRAPKEHEITAECLDFLSQLEVNKESMTPLMLSERMKISKTSISRIADFLSKKGYIEKRRDEKDKRSYFISITDFGTEQLGKIYKYYLEPLYELRRGLSEEEFEILINAIEKSNKLMSLTEGEFI